MTHTTILRYVFLFLMTVSFLPCSAQMRLTIGEKTFAEQTLLCEILKQHLHAQLGIETECKPFETTKAIHDALINGKIDLYVEYVGTALTELLHQSVAGTALSSDEAFSRVQALYHQKQWPIQWLAPLGFNDSFVFIIRKEDAQASKIATLSDAADTKKRPQGWILGVGPEFIYRLDGLEKLLEFYDLPLNQPVETMDIDTLYKALSEKRVDMVVGNSTDGVLSLQTGESGQLLSGGHLSRKRSKPRAQSSLLQLRDDKSFFPPYGAAVLVRSDALKKYQGLQKSLEQLKGMLQNETIKCLNSEVVVRKTELQGANSAPLAAENTEARYFLTDAGLSQTQPSSADNPSTGCLVRASVVPH